MSTHTQTVYTVLIDAPIPVVSREKTIQIYTRVFSTVAHRSPRGGHWIRTKLYVSICPCLPGRLTAYFTPCGLAPCHTPNREGGFDTADLRSQGVPIHTASAPDKPSKANLCHESQDGHPEKTNTSHYNSAPNKLRRSIFGSTRTESNSEFSQWVSNSS